YVTDEKGNPVTDLDRSEFELYDKGKPQKITEFERYVLSRPETIMREEIVSPPKEELAKLERKFFFLIDLLANDVMGLKKAKTAALHFVDSVVQSGDEAGVISYNPEKGLVLHEYLTSDPKRIRKAIGKIKAPPRLLSRMPMRSMEEGGKFERAAVNYFDSGALVSEETGEQDSELTYWKTRFNGFMLNLTEWAKSLRQEPGQKYLILFSQGIGGRLFYDQEDSAIRENYRKMCQEMSSAGTSVFSVNTYLPGTELVKMQELDMGEAKESRGEQGLAASDSYLRPSEVVPKDRIRSLSEADSLKTFSELTGGKYFPNVTYHENVAAEIQKIVANFYVLGYYIGENWDGRYHQIQVKVKRPGCRVYAQTGYYNPRPFSEFSEAEKNLHLLALAVGRKSDLLEPRELSSIALPCGKVNESNLVLISKFSKRELGEVIKGKAEVVTLVLDEANEVRIAKKGEMNFAQTPEETIYHYAVLSLPAGNYKCRVVVRNLKTGDAGRASSLATVSEEPASGLKLYPPLLLIPDENAGYLRLKKDKEEKTKKLPTSLKDIYPYIPSGYFPLVEGLEKRVSRLLAVVRFTVSGEGNSEKMVWARLFPQPTGEAIPLACSVASHQKVGELHVILLEISLPEVPAGEYLLNLTLGDTATKSTVEVNSPFSIK
ncbi:MAG: VWA domain-containing protein, partial [Acidobacteriota bacterium]